MNPILPAIGGFGNIARPRMRIVMALEPQRMINHPLSSRSVTMVPDDAPITHRRQKENRDNAATEAQHFGSGT